MTPEGSWGQWPKQDKESDLLETQEERNSQEGSTSSSADYHSKMAEVEKSFQEMHPALKERIDTEIENTARKLKTWDKAADAFKELQTSEGYKLSAKENYFRLNEYGSPHAKYEYFKGDGDFTIEAMWNAEIDAMSPAEKEAVDRVIGAKHSMLKALENYRENLGSYKRARHEALSPEEQEHYEKYGEYSAPQEKLLGRPDFFKGQVQDASTEPVADPVADEEPADWTGDELPHSKPVGDTDSDQLPQEKFTSPVADTDSDELPPQNI